MRATTPILAGALLALLAAGAWFALSPRGDAPALVEDASAPSPAPSEQAMALATRAPAAVAAPTDAVSGRLRVALLDPAGRPAEGVLVTARRTGVAWDPNDSTTWGEADPAQRLRGTFADLDAPKPQPPVDASGTTGAGGLLDLSVARTGQYRVEAHPAAPRLGSRAQVAVKRDEPAPSVVLRLLEGRPLKGRVLDAQDRGVAAFVTPLWPVPGSGNDGWRAAPLATDPATGAFAWAAVPDGDGLLTVLVPGRLRLDVRVATPRPDELVVRLPAGGVVKGRVTDGRGGAVAGADVVVNLEVRAATGDERTTWGAARAKTGEDGTYRIEGAPPGRVISASALAAGFLPRTDAARGAPWDGAVVREGAEVVVDFALSTGGSVEGRVVVLGTGAPVPDATVTLLTTQNRWGDRLAPVAADASGRFRFPGVPVGRYVLIATSPTHFLPALAPSGTNAVAFADGEADVSDAIVAVIAREGDALVRDVPMRPGVGLVGRVVGPDGAPLEGATVTAPRQGPWNTYWRWQVAQPVTPPGLATTGADGTFRVANLAPGVPYVFVATKKPYAGIPSAEVVVAHGDAPPPLTLRMEAGAVVEGRVLDADGAPAGGLSIQWWSQDAARPGTGTATSEVDGRFRLEGLPAAAVQLNVWNSGANANLQVQPPLAAGETRTGLELHLARSAKISGIVVDAQGRPLAGIPLVAAPQGQGNWGTATSREDGTFAVAQVGEGAYSVGVNPTGDANALQVPEEAVTVRAPATDVRVVARPRSQTTIAGRVLQPDGSPVPLCLLRTGATGWASGLLRSGDGGNEVVGGEFRRVVAAAPPFDVVVSAARGEDGRRLNLRTKTVRVEAAATDLVITLEAGLVVAGRVVDAAGAALPGVRVAVGTASALTDAAGAFRVEGLDAGGVDVGVTPPPGLAAPPGARVEAGTLDLLLTCTAGKTITGRILGPDGEPVTQGGVSAQWSGGTGWAQVDAQGAFRVDSLPADAVVTLTTNVHTPQGGTLRPKTLAGVPAGATDVVLRLERGAVLSGVVLDADGRPVAGHNVRASGAGDADTYAATDAEGRFTFQNLDVGPVTLTVMDTRTWRPASSPVAAEAPGTGVRLTLQRRVKLVGRVVGEGVAGFRVFAYPTGSDGSRVQPAATVEVAADGRFELDVYEGGTFSLGANRQDDDRFARLDGVRPGADLLLALEVGASIAGIVVRRDGGAAPAKAWVWASGPGWHAWTRLGEGGDFRLRGLPKGSYEVNVSAEDGTPGTPARAEAGATGLRLELPGP